MIWSIGLRRVKKRGIPITGSHNRGNTVAISIQEEINARH